MKIYIAGRIAGDRKYRQNSGRPPRRWREWGMWS